ncbi:MAG: DMT family transporter [Alphaproteobacteria bacterium]|nr:DMT family transporter [Alphaproteobacteria bacterium]
MRSETSSHTPVSELRVHGQLLLGRALVTTSFTVGAAITHALDPELLTFLRFALATALFAPYIIWRHGFAIPGVKAFVGYFLISACVVIFFWCMFEALRLTSALNAAALYTLLPGVAAIYAVILVREKIGVSRLAALVIGALGALWVLFKGDWELFLGLAFNQGDLIFLLGLLAMGLYTPLVRRFNRNEPAAVMAFWVLATGTIWLALLNNVAIFKLDMWAIDVTVLLGVAYLAVFTTIISFFIMQHATLHLGPTKVMSYGYLTPALVAAFEFAAGNGAPAPIVLPGIALTIAAMFVMQCRYFDAKTVGRG